MRSIASPIALLLGCLLVFSCASTPVREEPPRMVLQGMVYDRSGMPVAEARIGLDGAAAGVSDINGRFTIAEVSIAPHDITVAKDGYEGYAGRVTPASPVDVSYISLVSKTDLIGFTQEALRAKRWGEADAFIVRALAVAPQDPAVRFLAAVGYTVPGRPEMKVDAALAILNSLMSDGFDEPPVLLLAADLYQYEKGDMDRAKALLERYLKKNGD
jgi:hypothetical protein